MDEKDYYINPKIDIISLSQPISAQISFSFPSFRKSIRYFASVVTIPPGVPNYTVVAIVCSCIAFAVIILIVGLCFWMKKKQKELDQEETIPVTRSESVVLSEEETKRRVSLELSYSSFNKSVGLRTY
eukprot:TRINITY_DN11455_c0_g1_i1.p1 TRINITY_DN11455_c0_g1~~TRINITY_DN11455_c0_g1_i1.p1  ORF type:complete len:128 (-),score=30.20 TRINITY_DN11455_c0_g1_i1:185-568(-)